jgi:DNA invertase Pin-like site-specific DNA recombinase
MTKPGKTEQAAARAERLAAALRENLKRRKEQARKRGLERGGAPGQSEAANDGAGATPVPEFRRNRGRD